jgi:hypothetical protein
MTQIKPLPRTQTPSETPMAPFRNRLRTQGNSNLPTQEFMTELAHCRPCHPPPPRYPFAC